MKISLSFLVTVSIIAYAVTVHGLSTDGETSPAATTAGVTLAPGAPTTAGVTLAPGAPTTAGDTPVPGAPTTAGGTPAPGAPTTAGGTPVPGEPTTNSKENTGDGESSNTATTPATPPTSTSSAGVNRCCSVIMIIAVAVGLRMMV